MNIIHHGAKDGVTGSCHQLNTDEGKLLIDCGLFQGDESKPLNVDFPVKDIDALLVTHTHIDHIGRIPWLLAAGFRAPIYCTEATAQLMPMMLDDGLRLQLGMKPRQRKRVLNLIRSLIRPIKYDTWTDIKRASAASTQIASSSKSSASGPITSTIASIRFQPAGHILGSSYIEVALPNSEHVVFSGDLGPSNTPLLPDPISPERAGVLVIESTYGDKTHESIASRAERLKTLINRSLSDGGVIIIPAFSVGRTQELLFDIENLLATSLTDDEKCTWSTIPVILDSPMATKVTEQYRAFKSLWSQEAKTILDSGRHPLAFDQCITINTHRDHIGLVNRLKQTGEPAIVVAASGMCNGGRVLNYLKALLPDKRTDVILAGYQARGTLGRNIQRGDKHVNIDEENITINAHIHTMSGYSAHADRDDLLAFIEGIKQKPKEIRIVHGDKKAQEALGEVIEERELAEKAVLAVKV
ncbi:MBL fold metallo-hydrolase RNA specificity domain-containing protein [Enterovibrio norvegicus]|uniref:MBL fold metallo-hydrolase RNA specificity domain-containing protein n=1 Tax=Enterovibrio norvegicus TaxID=188144 RepID=UPI000C82CFDE|nr:MBL fold metallo-hydrolase [Enterovibrio norvegicus]PML81022.1 MBL fold hydrolase [Enterovibrio norvegicus]